MISPGYIYTNLSVNAVTADGSRYGGRSGFSPSSEKGQTDCNEALCWPECWLQMWTAVDLAFPHPDLPWVSNSAFRTRFPIGRELGHKILHQTSTNSSADPQGLRNITIKTKYIELRASRGGGGVGTEEERGTWYDQLLPGCWGNG